MKKSSAGIILVRKSNQLEILLGHLGGPFWVKKEDHAWSIPKGEFEQDKETALQAARREFKEETSLEILELLRPLPPYMKNNKNHFFFLLEKNVDPSGLKSNFFEVEWPPKSGKIVSFPELDRFSWFNLDAARKKIVKGQLPALEMVEVILGMV